MNIINFFVNLIKDPRTAIASWIAMGVVWVALGCLSADWLLSSVRAKRLARTGHQD